MLRFSAATARIVIGTLAIGIAVVALAVGDDPSSPAQTNSDGAVRALSFETAGPAKRRVILDVGGLTISAACNRVGARRPVDLLSVTAKSESRDASIV